MVEAEGAEEAVQLLGFYYTITMMLLHDIINCLSTGFDTF